MDCNDWRVSEYELHPYHLLAYHGNWYVTARSSIMGKHAAIDRGRMGAQRQDAVFIGTNPQFSSVEKSRVLVGNRAGLRT